MQINCIHQRIMKKILAGGVGRGGDTRMALKEMYVLQKGIEKHTNACMNQSLHWLYHWFHCHVPHGQL